MVADDRTIVPGPFILSVGQKGQKKKKTAKFCIEKRGESAFDLLLILLTNNRITMSAQGF
jgi:hypothetical protein